MKSVIILLLVGFLLLTACQSETPVATPAIEEVEQPTEQPSDSEAYPAPVEPVVVDQPYPYPYPVIQVPLVSNDPYAAPIQDEGASITWEQAKTLIMNGEVSQVTQLHSLKVTLVLKDGSTVYTVEPEIDAVFVIVDECGEMCANIIMATE